MEVVFSRAKKWHQANAMPFHITLIENTIKLRDWLIVFIANSGPEQRAAEGH
jgi:hypothetical protein